MAGSNGNPRGLMDRLSDSLENRIILLIAAGILGVGGNLAIVGTNPTIRADAHTATMDAKARRADMEKVAVMIAGVENGLREYIELRYQACDAHLVKAEKGWDLLYQMRADIQSMSHEIKSLHQTLEDLKRWPNGINHEH